ncbi:hypothetical protein BSKO_01084 [Bryopsis sp. KO-2023]|nr:hypothetical protein BSKO_01084 [Bryopsis sp. KO-2023]
MEKPAEKSELKKHRCCTGALYYSQALMDRRMPPICAGLRQAHKGSEDIEKLQTEAANLVEFKYVCVGYSQYDEKRIIEQPDRDGPAEGEVELPYCEGLEIISSRQLQRGPVLLKEGLDAPTGPQRGHEQVGPRRKSASANEDDPNFVPEPPGRFDWTKFPEKFQRTSELIVSKMQQNALHLISSAKKVLDQLSKD